MATLSSVLASLESTFEPLRADEYAEGLRALDALRKRLKAQMPMPAPTSLADFPLSSALPFEMRMYDRVVHPQHGMECAIVGAHAGRWAVAFYVYGEPIQMSNGSYVRPRGFRSFTGYGDDLLECKAMAALAAVHLAPIDSTLSVLIADDRDASLFSHPLSAFSGKTRRIVGEMRALAAFKTLRMKPNDRNGMFETLMVKAQQALIKG